MAAIPLPRALVETVYSRSVYPIVRQVVTGLSSLTSLVLFDVLLIGGLVALPGWWTLRLIRTPRGGRLRALASVTGQTVVFAAALYLVFLGVWGLNYRRESLGARLGYTESRVNGPVLETLTAAAIENLNQLYGSTQGGRWPQLDELPVQLGPAFARVQQRLGVSPAVLGLVPKRSVLTPYFRRAGIDGMVDPFFLQILVNDTVLPFERPFVTAHEWAHVAGFAHEAEANFVAWLTCLEGDDAMRVRRLVVSRAPSAGGLARGVAATAQCGARTGTASRFCGGACASESDDSGCTAQRAPDQRSLSEGESCADRRRQLRGGAAACGRHRPRAAAVVRGGAAVITSKRAHATKREDAV